MIMAWEPKDWVRQRTSLKVQSTELLSFRILCIHIVVSDVVEVSYMTNRLGEAHRLLTITRDAESVAL